MTAITSGLRARTFVAVLVGAVVLAACATPAVGPQGPQVTAATSAGQVLVDAAGMTLYVYDGDTPGRSNCTGVCALVWPPAIADHDARPSGVYTLIERGGGVRQWARDGRPLYGYSGDVRPGDARGDGLEGAWHVARP